MKKTRNTILGAGLAGALASTGYSLNEVDVIHIDPSGKAYKTDVLEIPKNKRNIKKLNLKFVEDEVAAPVAQSVAPSATIADNTPKASPKKDEKGNYPQRYLDLRLTLEDLTRNSISKTKWSTGFDGQYVEPFRKANFFVAGEGALRYMNANYGTDFRLALGNLFGNIAVAASKIESENKVDNQKLMNNYVLAAREILKGYGLDLTLFQGNNKFNVMLHSLKGNGTQALTHPLAGKSETAFVIDKNTNTPLANYLRFMFDHKGEKFNVNAYLAYVALSRTAVSYNGSPISNPRPINASESIIGGKLGLPLGKHLGASLGLKYDRPSDAKGFYEVNASLEYRF